MTDIAHEEHQHHEEIEYCPKHPNNEARLHCNRCSRPMCTKCAVHTPTGYRCDDCVKGQQKVFVTAKPQDYVFGPLVGTVLGAISGSILGGFGFWMLFLAPVAGGIIAEAARWAIGKRRGKPLFQAITAGVILGALAPTLLPFLRDVLTYGSLAITQGLGFFIGTIVWRLVFAVLAGGAAYYRLSGMRL